MSDAKINAKTNAVITHPDNKEPTAFTQKQLDWLPWLEPLAEGDFDERRREALVDPARIKSAYFRLLARDPDILEARTRTDKDIFYNVADGLPRAERELAAAATSRVNGCIYCASVHSRFATSYSKRGEEVQRLLDAGVGIRIDPRWDAVTAAAAAITATPASFDGSHIAALREAGLDDGEIVDVINAAAFFNWANRLMLSLGEPAGP
jgi:alkylhydroperoxidase domain protein